MGCTRVDSTNCQSKAIREKGVCNEHGQRDFFCHFSLDIQYSNCIDNIDNVLGVIGNPERMLRIREDVGRLYANVMPFYERGLSILEL